MPNQKIPLLEGYKIDECYDLDNESDLTRLGLNPNSSSKIADNYAHYNTCKYIVVEKKSSDVKKAVEQLKSTVERLIQQERKVDYVVIVSNRIESPENRIYKQNEDKKLILRSNNSPVEVRIGSYRWPVYLYYPWQVDETYKLEHFLEGE